MLTIDTVGAGGPGDVSDLLPMLRAYCDFYRVDPSDERLRALATALIDNPSEGLQLIARDSGAAAAATSDSGAAAAATSDKGTPLGFATIYWTWQTLYAARVGVLNDLFVTPASRGTGTGRALIQRCLELCRERGAEKLVWETAPDNTTAQRLYDGIGAEKSTWLTYELDAR
jgi:GNAT superfamily N-acetyltransferase